jgi:quinol monooxygenase YgiN
MSKISVLAKLTTHDGKGDELVKGFDDLFTQVDKEPGTLVYALNRSAENPNVFWFFELYADGDSLAAHGQSDAMKAAGGLFGSLLESFELVISSPVRAKGLDV